MNCPAQFYEQILAKKLIFFDDKNASNEIQSNLNEISTCFQHLLDCYAFDKEFEKIFQLIDYIENVFINVRPYLANDILRLIGDFFYKCDLELKALEYYRKAVQMSNEENLFALESYENLLNNNIERWHFRMINDKIRNKAYADAIRKRLMQMANEAQTVRVLDIGTGTGLLSAQCLSQKVKTNQIKIVACEANPIFYEISNQFIESIDSSNVIEIINKHSNDLRKKTDLIITEIFDDGLLGENCLDTFYNALVVNKLIDDTKHTNLTRTIPKSAQLYICAIECKKLRKSNSFILELIKNPEENKLIRIVCTCLDNSINFEITSQQDICYEPYTTEDLKLIPFTLISDPVEISEFLIEFDNEKFLEEYCKLNKLTTLKKELKCIKDGQLDAFVAWFDLNLDDTIKLTNSPLSDFNDSNRIISPCWHQSIYNIQETIKFKQNELIHVDLKLRKDCLLVTHQPKSQASEANVNIALNRLEISILNDRSYQDYYSKWFSQLFREEISTKLNNQKINIGFLSNTLNVLLFELLYQYSSKLSIFYFISSTEEKDLQLKAILEKHFVNIEIVYLNEENINENLKTQTRFSIDYLIIEPIDFRFGILKKNLLSDVLLIKNFYAKEQIKIHPNVIKLKGLFIESSSLAKECDLITNENICMNSAFDLKKILANYRVKHQYDIRIEHLSDLKRLTQIETVFSFELHKLMSIESQVSNVDYFRVIDNGYITCFLYWLEFSNHAREQVLNEFTSSTSLYAAIAFFNETKLLVNSHHGIKTKCLFKNDIFHMKLNGLISSNKNISF